MLFKNFKRIFKKPDENKEDELREELYEDGGLEKKDLGAMILSAYLIIIPIALGVLLLLYFVAKLLLGEHRSNDLCSFLILINSLRYL